MTATKKWIIGVAVLLGLIVLAVGGFFFYQWYVRNKKIIHDATDLPDGPAATVQNSNTMTVDTDLRGQTSLTLGLQNNNPGNLRDNGDHWQGIDPNQRTYYGFLRFATLKYGIRANVINISNLIKVCGSIRSYITAYAPPSENNTEVYISRLCQLSGLSENTVPALDYPTLKLLIRAHYIIENDANVFDHVSDADIDAGFALSPYKPVAA